MLPPPAKELPSTTIKIDDNMVYVVDFIKEKFFQEK
jgi:hypothetical protein